MCLFLTGIRCSDPPTIADTSWEMDKYSAIQRVTYRCFPEFVYVSGTLERECETNGEWSRGNTIVCNSRLSIVITIMTTNDSKRLKLNLL